MLFVIGYAYFLDRPVFPARLVPVYGFGLAFLFLVLFRNMARVVRIILFRFDRGITNILLVGNTQVTRDIAFSLKDSYLSGYRVLGLVGPKSVEGFTTFPNFSRAVDTLGRSRIHSIVQTELYSVAEKNNEILDYAQSNHIGYRFIPGNTELFVGNIRVELFRGSLPVIAVHQTSLLGWGRLVKRAFDVIVAVLLLVLSSPLWLFVIVLELLSGGNVFFRQERLTRFDQRFKVFKFRTIKKVYNGLTPEEAFEKMGKPELAKAFRDNGDFLNKDPRISKVGSFLRRTSLDELPQLLNVIKGDLSLVGPRALIPQELKSVEKRHAILSVKSGLTGLAQVSGRKNISFDERRRLDVYYVQNWSFWLDITILLKTIRVILQGS
jgi:exopolysaccharide biosynthesis polyprenyl glycosylphosphotransferase